MTPSDETQQKAQIHELEKTLSELRVQVDNKVGAATATIRELEKTLTDLRVQVATKIGATAATARWVLVVALLLAAWLGVTSVYQIPAAVTQGLHSSAATQAAAAAEYSAIAAEAARGRAEKADGAIAALQKQYADRYLVTRKEINLAAIVDNDRDKATKYKPDAAGNIRIDCQIDVDAPVGYHLLSSAGPDRGAVAWAVPNQNPQYVSGVLSIDAAKDDPKAVWLHYYGSFMTNGHSYQFAILVFCVWEKDASIENAKMPS